MKKLMILLSLLLLAACSKQQDTTQNWTHYVRTAGHGLNLSSIDGIIKDATETHLFGIEVDNSLTGYYESFLEPDEKLKAIKALADSAHKIGNRAFVYTEGLETITANSDQKQHTFFKDHPDWVQRDINGRPAVFGGGSAFWISEGDEDVWISPFAEEWRKMYMERIRQIAATGIDGIFIDIPYWMTHFNDWEDTWSSFDDYTIAAFKELTGLDAKTDIKLGDFEDPGFIKWVNFRMEALTDFMKDVNENAKSVNPDCMVIAEIYPGIEEAAVCVGADVYQMYQVVDVIAHEYSGGGGNAAHKDPLDWFSYMTGMYTFRAFAENKASWMLSYSWSKGDSVDPRDAIENLLMAQVMAGTNCWDARGHVMSGSNDIDTRKQVYAWIAKHEKLFYKPRTPIQPIGIYFSPKTRNYFSKEFMQSYKGWMNILLQSHLEFQIITPRTLSKFEGEILIMPDVKCLDTSEISAIKTMINTGKGVVLTGETGWYDDKRERFVENPILKHIQLHDAGNNENPVIENNIIYFASCPGRHYMHQLKTHFNNSAAAGDYQDRPFHTFRKTIINKITETLNYSSLQIEASPFVTAQIARVENNVHIFFANFKGLKGNTNARQTAEEDVVVRFKADRHKKIALLPFLGGKKYLKGEFNNNELRCTLPPIERGAVVWLE